MMTKTEWLKWADGRSIDLDGVPKDNPYQCADAAKSYVKKCYDIDFTFTSPSNPYGYVSGLYLYFDEHPEFKGKFIRIKNTPDFVPQKGDIVEWGAGDPCGKAGHTAVALGKSTDTTKWFSSLDQNWKKPYCREVLHRYTGVLGVIRPLLKVTTTDLNVRDGAGTQYKKVGEIPGGTLVKPSKYTNGWAYIPAYGGWVAGNYLD